MGEIADLGKLARQLPADGRMLHTRRVLIEIPLFGRILQMDGSEVLTFDGIPPGSVCLGARTLSGQKPDGTKVGVIEALFYHPDFPATLEAVPPEIRVGYNFTALVQAQADAVAAQAEVTGE